MEQMRLQKFLSAAGVCSRRQGEVFIAEGIVRVNGEVVTTPGTKIDPDKDRVTFRGKPVSLKEKVLYIALNKPVGVESTCKRGRGKIILDVVRIPERIYPVGRLDKDSEGLILLTNDGALHHRLSHPSFEHEKEYEVTVKRPISDKTLAEMADGMTLAEFSTMPCRIKRLGANRYNITLREGKNRQIRKMAEHVGHDVIRLKRVRIAGVRLGALSTGKWRNLSPDEVKRLTEPVAKRRK